MRSKKEARPTVDAIVFDTLDNWGEWQENAHLSGCASIYQILAIMLWCRVSESPSMTKQDESAFVLAWAEKIKEATATRAATLGSSPAFRFLTPLDQVTRMEPTDYRAIKTLDGWVINWRDVDEWLFEQGYQKLCACFFECATQNTQAKDEWTSQRSEARLAQLEGDGRGKSKKIAQKDMSPEWNGQKLLARKMELKRKGVRSSTHQTAKEAGIPVREVNRRINALKNGGALAGMACQLGKTGDKRKSA